MRGWKIVLSALIVTGLIIINLFFLNNHDEESWLKITKYTARVSGILFAIAFSASSLQYYIKGIFGFWISSNRKYFGISFAIIHLIHLACIGALFYQYPPEDTIDLVSILGGGIAYLFTLIMLISSFDLIKNRMNFYLWKKLHTTGGYWIWGIFMISYLQRVDNDLSYAPFVGLFAMILLLRITKLFLQRQNSLIT